MPDYRAYILGVDGHRFVFVESFLSNHPDDAAALMAAKKLIDGHDIEVWDRGRLVARLDHKTGNPISDSPMLAWGAAEPISGTGIGSPSDSDQVSQNDDQAVEIAGSGK
nr:hypothetical protein [Bradyrhizobium sp.]